MEGSMQIQDDDFPYTSDDPSLAPSEGNTPALGLTSQELGDLKATMRLVIGSTLTGKDVFSQQLRRMQATQELTKPGTIQIDEDETFRDQLRYLLLGIMFETPDVIQRGLENVEKASSKIYGLFSKVLSPFTNSWIFSPVKNQVDYAAARGERVIDRLIMKGRVEEQNSRLIMQQENINELMNEFVDYLVLTTEIRQIIQEAGVNVAGDVVGDFQEQSAAVDSLMEGKLKSIFGKRPPAPNATPPSQPKEGG
jgi:hypothetical protein